MRNREIYQQIGDTFLSKDRKKTKPKSKKKKWFISLAVINLIILFTALFLIKGVISHTRDTSASIYLLSERYPLKLSYDLRPPQVGIKDFSFSIPLVDAKEYNWVKLRIRGDRRFGFSNILRIDIGSARREKDSYYIKDINANWREFSIALSEFKNITDWSQINHLSFIFEDWNVSSKNGIIYIDNLRFSE